MEAIIGRLYRLNIKTILEEIATGSLEGIPKIMGNGVCYAGKHCTMRKDTISKKVVGGLSIKRESGRYNLHLECLEGLIEDYTSKH